MRPAAKERMKEMESVEGRGGSLGEEGGQRVMEDRALPIWYAHSLREQRSVRMRDEDGRMDGRRGREGEGEGEGDAEKEYEMKERAQSKKI